MVEPVSRAAFALLSEPQRAYLRLVNAGRTSKEIAQQLGGSYHTINAEIAKACGILGASGRAQAAAWLASHEAANASYDGSHEGSYEPPPVAVPPAAQANEGTANGVAAVQTAPRGPTVFPFATAGHPHNDLPIGRRLAWILAIAALTALLAVGLLGSVDGTLRRLADLF